MMSISSRERPFQKSSSVVLDCGGEGEILACSFRVVYVDDGDEKHVDNTLWKEKTINI